MRNGLGFEIQGIKVCVPEVKIIHTFDFIYLFSFDLLIELSTHYLILYYILEEVSVKSIKSIIHFIEANINYFTLFNEFFTCSLY